MQMNQQSMSLECWIYHFELKGTQSADAHVYFIPFLSWFGWFANNNNNNDDDDLLTDQLGGSSLLNYINYNYKINQIKLFTNYTVEAGLTESSYSKTN